MNFYSERMEAEEPAMMYENHKMKNKRGMSAKAVLFYSLLVICVAILFINLIFLVYAVSVIVVKKPEYVDLI